MVVLPRRVDDEIRFEFRDDGQDQLLQHVEEPLVGGLRRQGDVDRRPQGIGAAELVGEARARVEGPPVLVDGDVERVRVVPVDVLGAVAVVAVRVDDGDALVAVFAADVLDHDGLDVDVAEAAGPMDDAHGVVPRGPHQREGIVHLAGEHLLGRRDGASRRDQMALGDDALCVGDTEVDPVDVLDRGQSGLVLHDVLEVEQPLLEDLVLRVEQALLPLRVGGRDGPVEGGKEDEPRFFQPFHERASPLPNPAIRPGLTWALRRMFFPVA